MREIDVFVRGLVQREVVPVLTTVKSTCANEITRHKEQVYQEFWTKLQKPLKMSEAISLILDAKGMY